MAFSITQFQNNTTNLLSALDNNFVTGSAQAPIPCSVAGTNTLTLTQSAAGLVPSSPVTAYTNGMRFTGIAAATNTASVTAVVGSLAALNVYKDSLSGPVVLTGQEIVASCAFSLVYDSTLNSGSGGFHLISTTAQASSRINPSSIQVNGNSILTNLVSGTFALTFTATPGWSSQDQLFSFTAAIAAAQSSQLPAVGDFVQVTPPSIAAAGVSYAAMVTAGGSLSSTASASTLAIRLINSASASLASNSGVYRYAAMRSSP